MKTASPKLTRREREVANLVAQGLTSREIGEKLFISERTAEGHVEKIRSKLGFRSRAEIGAWVARTETEETTAGTPVGLAAPTANRAQLPALASSPARAPAVRLRPRTLLASGSALVVLAAMILVLDTLATRLSVTPTVQPISTFAGTGYRLVSDDGKLPRDTDLEGPSGIAIGQDGAVYFVEGARIRKVDGPNGLVTTIAGNGRGNNKWGDTNSAINTDLRLLVNGGNDFSDFYTTPLYVGLAPSADGGIVFADPFHGRVRKVTSDGRLVTLAGGGAPPGFFFSTGPPSNVGDNGPAPASLMVWPQGCAFDAQGNLYIADTIDNRIRVIDHSTGLITTLAGDGKAAFSGDNGPANLAELNSPMAVAIGRDGAIYIADTGNQRIRRIKDGIIATFAGDGVEGYRGDGGPATNAELDVPLGLALDLHDNLYVADSNNDRIRKVDSANRITTVAGTGVRGYGGDQGSAARAQLAQPVAVAVDAADNLYVVDSLNNRIRVVALDRGL